VEQPPGTSTGTAARAVAGTSEGPAAGTSHGQAATALTATLTATAALTAAGTGTGTPTLPAGTRCAAHPSRLAHDLCPTCGRPRCARDAEAGSHCRLCGTDRARGAVRPPLVALSAAAGSATVLTVAGAALGQEYVGAHIFSVVFPALVGIVLAAGAVAVAGPLSTTVRRVVAVLIGSYAAVSSLLDFRFTALPFGPPSRWLPPLVAAAVAGVLATEVLARRPPATSTPPPGPPAT
jgi:hypothetical protein